MVRVDVTLIGGGQSGPAAAHPCRATLLGPVALEASDRAAGSWPRGYDGLTLLSPARPAPLAAPSGSADRHRIAGRHSPRRVRSRVRPSRAFHP